MRSMILAVVLLIVATACTSSEPVATTDAPSTTSTGEAVPVAPTTTAGSDAAATTTRGPETQATVDSVPVPEGPPYLEGIALPEVTLLTAPSGGGERPLLEWEPVDGAAWYQPIVLTSSGETYWNWVTEDTSVFVSGVESDVTTGPGPRVSADMSWAVLAFDDADQLIAQSQVRPIEP